METVDVKDYRQCFSFVATRKFEHIIKNTIFHAVPPGDNQSNYQLAKNNDDDSLKLVEQIFHDVQLAVISVFLLEVS